MVAGDIVRDLEMIVVSPSQADLPCAVGTASIACLVAVDMPRSIGIFEEYNQQVLSAALCYWSCVGLQKTIRKETLNTVTGSGNI